MRAEAGRVNNEGGLTVDMIYDIDNLLIPIREEVLA